MDYTVKEKLNRAGTAELIEIKETGELLVRKELEVFDSSVYEYLYTNKPKGTPQIKSYEKQGDSLIVLEEYIDGESLEKIIEEGGPLEPERGFKILLRICDILSPLHLNNPPIVHRDIKPSNVLITPTDEVYLLDFNAATEYSEDKDRDTVLIGTVGYAAPEQYGFKASDPRTDVYAMGRLAQEIFTGEKSAASDYKGPFKGVVKKCLNLDPEGRYKNAKALSAALSNMGKRGFKNGDPWYLPPGFRTKKIWKMVLAVLWYYIVFSSFIEPHWGRPAPEFRYNVCLFIFLILETFVAANYLGLVDMLPIASSKNLWVKALGRVIYMALLFVIFVIIIGLLESAGIIAQ